MIDPIIVDEQSREVPENIMRLRKNNAGLTQLGPGTPTGALCRGYWSPANTRLQTGEQVG